MGFVSVAEALHLFDNTFACPVYIYILSSKFFFYLKLLFLKNSFFKKSGEIGK
jgi:hypothetical protein